MKLLSKFWSFVLLVAALCYAGTYDSRPSNDVGRVSYIHNAFYFEASLGMQYLNMHYENSETDYYTYYGPSGGVDETEFSGFGPDFTARFGGVFGSRVAVFSFLEIASLKWGDYTYSEKRKNEKTVSVDFSSDAFRFLLGSGLNFYFFRNPEHDLYGLYAGAAFGILYIHAGDEGSDKFDGLEYKDIDSDNLKFNEVGYSVSFEIGKLWYLSDLLNFGVALQASYDELAQDSDDNYDRDIEESGIFTITLKVNFVRK